MMAWLAEYAGLVGLLFFFGIFVGIAVWLYWPGRKQYIDPLATIPLREDENE